MKPAWLPGPRSDSGDELEALQTDVMRFVAILGLCLAAIFSLLQSLEQVPQTPPQSLLSRDLLTRQTDKLLTDNRVLAKELSTLREQLGQQLGRETQLRSSVAALEQERQLQEMQLEQLSQLATESATDLVEAERRLRAASIRSQQIQARLVEQQQAAREKLDAEEETPARRSQVTREPTAGFSLGFASDEALRTLIGQGSVGLYVQLEGKYWRLHDEMRSVGTTDPPPSLYDMHATTVPKDLARQFARVLGEQWRHARWGVTLPSATAKRVAELLAIHTGGELRIMPDGSVKHLP